MEAVGRDEIGPTKFNKNFERGAQLANRRMTTLRRQARPDSGDAVELLLRAVETRKKVDIEAATGRSCSSISCAACFSRRT
jgi:hypothetical protein